jgi:hypothetical protein
MPPGGFAHTISDIFDRRCADRRSPEPSLIVAAWDPAAALASANLRQREVVLSALCDLPQTRVATAAEILDFIERHALSGRGIG